MKSGRRQPGGWRAAAVAASGAAVLWLAGCASVPAGGGSASPASDRTAPARSSVAETAPSALPRVMVLVDEKNLGTIATSEVESLLMARLIERRVPVVDPDMLRANTARRQQLLKSVGDNRGAAAIGAQFGADVLIVGEAVAKPSARRIGDTNLRAYQAVATLRAVRADSSDTIATASEDATVAALEDIAGSAKALRAAAGKTADRLVPAVLNGWASPTSAPESYPHRIEATFGGVDQLWKLQGIRETLRGMSGVVRSVAQRGYTTGVATFTMESACPPEELVETLVMHPPEGLKLQALDVQAQSVQFKVVEAP